MAQVGLGSVEEEAVANDEAGHLEGEKYGDGEVEGVEDLEVGAFSVEVMERVFEGEEDA